MNGSNRWRFESTLKMSEEMVNIKKTAVLTKPDKKEVVLCPLCGTLMFESDRLAENNCMFVWYECGSNNCVGQWLDKHCIDKKLRRI